MARRIPLKQQRFVANYILLGGNGVRAVFASGYRQGYDSARVTASRLLTKANVINEIEKHAAKAQMKAEEVLEELSAVAQTGVEKVTTADKLKALELLGKFHKLFTDRTETVDLTENEKEKARIYLADEVKRIRLKYPDDVDAAEEQIAQFKALQADRSDPSYNPLLDYTKHPENWPPLEQTPQVVEGEQ